MPKDAQAALDAPRAIVILLVYLGVQFAVGVIVGTVAFRIASAEGGNVRNPEEWTTLARTIVGPATFLAFMTGGMAMFLLCRSRIRRYLSDTSPTGAAWTLGSSKNIVQGLGMGVLAACLFYGLALTFKRSGHTEIGPIAAMAITPGIPQLLWLFMMLLAPLIEELLFRGVLYGGFRSSFGPVRAAALTTSIFWVLHLTETFYFWPAMIGIAGLAVAALWFRLRSSAIGPAVAVHFGYNATLAVVTVCSRWM